jgi:hypothetical protein
MTHLGSGVHIDTELERVLHRIRVGTLDSHVEGALLRL